MNPDVSTQEEHHNPTNIHLTAMAKTKNMKGKYAAKGPLRKAPYVKPDPTKPKDERHRPAKKEAKKPQRPTIPFVAEEDRILLVGEGDFSFAKSIVEHHGACDVTATCYDGQAELFEKYKPQAEEHVKYLEDEGQTVLYNIDATKLNHNKTLSKAGLFNHILFNFPHVGGKSTDVNRQVRFNQELLVKFFAAAKNLLALDGTIVVTLFDGEPYTLWNIRDLARHSELEVQRSFKFQASAYPGYSHARTLGNIEGGGGWKGEDRESRSYVFEKQKEYKGNKSPFAAKVAAEQKKKKAEESGSSDEDE
jgi:25S rRNA (uracil2634-N3)-methyltransferase